MSSVKKILGVAVDSLSNIYGSAISGFSKIMGVDLAGTTLSGPINFIFDGSYTPPNGNDTDFF